MNYSVIIPAYNEDTCIRGLLKELGEVLKSENQICEIIVVNDCSKDTTRYEVINSGIEVELIDHPVNMGYGASLKSGIQRARTDYIVIIDADGTYPVKMIPELAYAAKENKIDMVVGARSQMDINIPILRKPAKWFINKLANALSGIEIPDLNSGLRVMKKSVLQRYLQLLPNGFSFTSTITLLLLSNGHTVEYIPIEYFKRQGKSKIRPIQDTLNFIQLILRITLYFNPLKIFIPLSIILFFLSLIILFGSWIIFGKPMDVSFGVVLMTSIFVLAIGMLADLIDKRLK